MSSTFDESNVGPVVYEGGDCHTCPTCEADPTLDADPFDSQRAVKVHHYRAHGKRLADRVCKGCNESFACRRSEQEYCTIQCFNNTKRDRVSVTCGSCYATFEAWPGDLSRGNAQFCSRRCKDISETRNFGIAGAYRRFRRPTEFKELVRHVYVYEGRSLDTTKRIVDVELNGAHSGADVEAMVSELKELDHNVRNRVWALRPEDLGLSPIGEVANQ